jgi:hypothetical protein
LTGTAEFLPSLRANGRRNAPPDERSNPEAAKQELDCFVARAPRNDEKNTLT